MLYYEEKGENPEDMMITPGYYTSGAFLGFTPEIYTDYLWKIGDHVIFNAVGMRKLPTRKETLAEFSRLLKFIHQHRMVPVVVPNGNDMLLKLAQEAGMELRTVEVKGESFTGYMLRKEGKTWIQRLFGS